MTANQIALFSATETQRANQAREAETHRSNRANEDLKQQELAESNRSHLASESIELFKSKEQARSNKANERLRKKEGKETHRSNLAREANDIYRTNTEAETSRYRTDTEANTAAERRRTDETIARISANATLTAAQLAANATRYMADASTLQQRLHELAENQRNTERVISNEQIAEADRLSREVIESAKRALEAKQASDNVALQKSYQQIEKLKAKVDKKFKNDKITNEQYQMILQAVNEYLRTRRAARPGR